MTVSSAAEKGWELWQGTKRRILAFCTPWTSGPQEQWCGHRVYNPSSGFQGNILSCKIKVLSKPVWWYRFSIMFKAICNRSPLLLLLPLFFLLLIRNKYFMLFLHFHFEFYSSGSFFFSLVVDVIRLPALLQLIKFSFVFLSFTGLLAWFPLSLEIMVSSNTFHVALALLLLFYFIPRR